MRVLYRSELPTPVELSIVLVDWSARESLHALDYLATQTVDRKRYELIWVEYYDHHAPGMAGRFAAAHESGGAVPVDQWILLGMPAGSYYHKHLLYNVGILAARGRIVNICDSDAIFSPSYVQSILSAFERHPGIVLHMDEIRSASRRFYPFNYPSIPEILSSEVMNLVQGKPAGIASREDLPVEDRLHVANYGASMSALREDLIQIGGADEHDDYLGHVCGPYEMTFRLGNLGRREVWHSEEWLYHTWHPGQSGTGNYMGPHDGRDLSTTALRVRHTDRVLPLRENPGIRMLRERVLRPRAWAPPLECATAEGFAERWSPKRLTLRNGPEVRAWRAFVQHPRLMAQLAEHTLRDSLEYARLMIRVDHRAPRSEDPARRRPRAAFGSKAIHALVRMGTAGRLVMRMVRFNRAISARSVHRLAGLRAAGIREILLIGAEPLLGVVQSFAGEFGIRIAAILDEAGLAESHRKAVERGVPVLIAARYGLRRRRAWLAEQGVCSALIESVEDAWEEIEPAARLPRDPPRPDVDLSILLPTRGRPQRLQQTLTSFVETAGDPGRLEVVLAIDEDDEATQQITHPGLRLIRVINRPGIGMGALTNRAFQSSRGRFVMLANDDLRIRTQGWDRRIVEACARHTDGVSLVYTNDAHQGERLATFPILPRTVSEVLGSLACHRVNHFHVESHLHEIFRELRRLGEDRVIYLDDVKIEHVHEPLEFPTRRPKQVRGDRDDRVTFCSLRDERKRAAQRLLRKIRASSTGPGACAAGRESFPVVDPSASPPSVEVFHLAADRCGHPVGRATAPDSLHLTFGTLPPDCQALAIRMPGMRAEPGWEEAALGALRDSAAVGAITGPLVLSRNGRLLRAGILLERRSRQTVLIDRLRGLSRRDRRARERVWVHAASLGGLVLRASALRELGAIRLDPAAPLSSGILLCRRLVECGFSVLYEPRLCWVLDDDAEAPEIESLARVLEDLALPGDSPALYEEGVRATLDGLELVQPRIES